MSTLSAWARATIGKLDTPRKRIACVTAIMAVIWGAMMICQGARGPCHTPDWALMSEVGRRVALGDTLYVDAMDQKGPLCYATYALLWRVFHLPAVVYVASNVLVWISLVASSAIAALMMEESRKPWAHIVAQSALAATLFVPHVGCVELWLVPFGLLGALWVRRLANGREVHPACWAVMGISAGYAVGTKFTCAAQFFFLLCYAVSRKNTKGLARAVAIALIACALTVCATLTWVWLAGSFEGMMRHHVHAASDGYASRMSMLEHLTSPNPSNTHVGSFALGLAATLLSTITILRSARPRRRIFALLGIVALAACCFATFVGYYRFQLAPLAVMGACDMRSVVFPQFKNSPRWTLAWRCALWAVGIVLIGATTTYTCDNTLPMVQSAERMKAMVHKTIGDDNSVLAWTFGHTWVYAELGLDYYYPMPAQYNASHDLWDQTAVADSAKHKWRYIVVSVDDDVEPGDSVNVGNIWCDVLAVEGTTAVVDAGGGIVALADPPYRIP